MSAQKYYKTFWNTVLIECFRFWLYRACETDCFKWPPGWKIPFYVGIVLTAAKHEDEKVAAVDRADLVSLEHILLDDLWFCKHDL